MTQPNFNQKFSQKDLAVFRQPEGLFKVVDPGREHHVQPRAELRVDGLRGVVRGLHHETFSTTIHEPPHGSTKAWKATAT
jgi:hypothetical protein